MINGLMFVVVGAASNQADIPYIWERATLEAKAIIVLLIGFSIVVWSVMGYKAMQMRRARRLNYYLTANYRWKAVHYTRFIKPAAGSSTGDCAAPAASETDKASRSKTWSTSSGPSKMSLPRNP